MSGMGAMGWLQAAQSFTDAYNTHQQGKIAKTRLERERLYSEFRQWAAERQAGIVVAASQRTAAEELRQADLVASRALAVAAASGGGVSDPTVVDILARTRGEGVYRANVALYEGEERSRAIRISGAGGVEFNTDRSVMAGYNAAAAGKLARTGLSLYAKYGMNGPGAQPQTGSGDSSLIRDLDT
jgi:hypothetical protein